MRRPVQPNKFISLPRARSTLEVAIEFARRGFPIIPLFSVRERGDGVLGCSCGAPECRSPGKHPPIKYAGATTDVVRIARWRELRAHWDFGALLGDPTRVVVFDFDGDAGHETRATLEAIYGPLPDTLMQETGRPEGGYHLFYRVPLHMNLYAITNKKIAPGLDTKGDGGLVALAPKLHISGRRYRFINDLAIAKLPEWLYKFAVSRVERQREFSSCGSRPGESDLPPVELRKRFAQERIECGIVPPAIQGQGGSTACLRAAIEIVRGYCVPVEDGQAFDVLWASYNPFCVPPWDANELDDLQHKIADAELTVDIPWRYRLDYRLALELALTRDAEGGGSGSCMDSGSGSGSCMDSGSGSGEGDRSDNGPAVCRDDGARSATADSHIDRLAIDQHVPSTTYCETSINAYASTEPRGTQLARCLINDINTPTPSTKTISNTASTVNSLNLASTARSEAVPNPAHRSISEPESRPAPSMIEQLIAKMPSRSISTPELLKLLHSKARNIAENGPRLGKTPEGRAFLLALACVYIGADVQSTTELLLNCRGGIAVQQARDPAGYAMQLWLDAWRARDREFAAVKIMMVDKLFIDTAADPTRTRALSRATFKLRPVDKPKTETFENQRPWSIPVRLGPPHRGEVSGEWIETAAACDAGALPGRRRLRLPYESWQDALVCVVLNNDGNVRHLLPIDPDFVAQIRGALGIAAAFAVFAGEVS